MEEDTTTPAMEDQDTQDLQALRENPLSDHRALKGRQDLQEEGMMASRAHRAHLGHLGRLFLEPTEAHRPSTSQDLLDRQELRDCRVTHQG